MRKIGIIDMGTNTFHLLIAVAEEDTMSLRIAFRDQEAVRLGRGGINEQIIPDDAYARARETFRRFRRQLDDHGVTDIIAYGTSAMRNARNGSALARQLEDDTQIPVRIIDGQQEASLIYAGVRASVSSGEEDALVMDIGAGSVEFIIGNDTTVHWQESLEIGGQRLLEKFQHHDPILPEEVRALEAYLHHALAPLTTAMERYRPRTLIGSSGSFDTLSDMYCIRRGIERPEASRESPLTWEVFREIHRDLLVRNRAERLALPGMIDMRVDMIVVASCLIDFVRQRFTPEHVRVSSWSLREGVMMRWLQNLSLP